MPFLAIFSQPSTYLCPFTIRIKNSCIGSGNERKASQTFLSTPIILSAICATGLLVRLGGSRGGFPGGGNILAAGTLQDFLGPIDFIRGIAMDGEENSPLLQAPFITLRLIFRDSQPDQSAREATDGAADSNPSQCSHDGPGCDEGTNSGNRKSADSGEQPQSSTQDCA